MAAALRAAALPLALIVAAVTLLVLVVSLSASARYRATARIVQDPASVAAGTGAVDADQRGLATSLAFLNTPAVREAAATGVPGETAASLEHKVTGEVKSGANVIDVSATDTGPSRAAAIANAVARAFLDRRAEAERASIARTREALEDQLTPGTPSDQAAAIRSRLGDLAVQSANAGSDLQLAVEARPPSSPYAPRPLRNAVIAFFATLFVGVVAVLVLERLRPHARGALALGRLTGMPVLATLPSAKSSFGREASSRLISLSRRLPDALALPLESAGERLGRNPASSADRVRIETDEAMWSLLGAILPELRPSGRHVLLVASPRQSQGSARVAAGLARALARAGHATLALTTDGGSTDLARELAVSSEPGLAMPSDWVAAPYTQSLHLTVVHGRDGVAVIPHNGMPTGGAGLLRPGAVDALFAAIAETSYGYVVIETPGLLTGPEPRLLARHADAIVLVCPERAPELDVVDARAALAPLASLVLGVVVTPGDGSAKPDLPEPAAGNTTPAPRPEAARHPDGGLPASVLASRDAGLALAGLDAAAASESTGIAEGEAREVLEQLRAAGRPLTAAELRTELGDPPAARVRSSLRRLVDRGEVVREGHGRKGDPYVYASADR
jgi:capsular polysaccharide biosynthesis protein/Mrp family chromosome partitioning ATPase